MSNEELAYKFADEARGKIKGHFDKALYAAKQMAEYKDNEYSELIKRANENSTKQFALGADKERKRVIDAAAEWLDKNVTRYAGFDYISEDFSMADNFIKDFKKAVRKALK